MRATREGQVFLVNGRWVQSPALSQALRHAYGNLLPHGRFPAAVVWLTVPPDRLRCERASDQARGALRRRRHGLLAGRGRVRAQPLSAIHPPFSVAQGGEDALPAWADRVRERPAAPSTGQMPLLLPVPGGAASDAPVAIPAGGGTAPEATDEPSPASAATASATTSEPEMWQLHRTYILAPVRGGMVIVDQHAAHERILYEEAIARLRGGQGGAQGLLFPVLVDLSRAQFELLLEVGPLLQQLGWDLSPLSPPTVVVKGVPSGLRVDRPGQLLQDVIDGISEGGPTRTGRSPRTRRQLACVSFGHPRR
jgi:DNA mismatch repair protein MutL